jgi:signal transduction histidine kinase
VANVTHELKTPLTSIRMFAETMRMGRIKGKIDQEEYLSIIVNESERLTRLINTVLDFSKIEQGKKRYNLIKTNISKVVQSAIYAMEYSLKEAGFDLKSEIEQNIQTKADADAIEQAVLNLMSNAVKYSNSNKEIEVKLFSKDCSIFIQVADKGIGIPESEQKKIFEKFYRAHTGHEKDTGGAGLGLTVVQHIVDAHNGKIELESKVGEGSTFTIVLLK